MEVVSNILSHTWAFWVEASPWLILGFVAAGLVHAFLSADFVATHLGKGKVWPVIKAAMLGIPLPLCSCGVLPAALGLNKKGASKGATLSFLISTPETGVDSMAVTYALMDPVMAVWRPFAALVSALIAGVSESFLGSESNNINDAEPDRSCGCDDVAAPRGPVFKRMVKGVGFAFDDLLRDLLPWLLLGTFIAGTVSALVPEGWFEAALGGGFKPMLIMLVVGVPMYICATASTPVAAALMLKGLSPGAALVFLLVGPATNTASILALWKNLGAATTIRYLISLCVGALLMGYGLELVYPMLGMEPSVSVGVGQEGAPGMSATVSAVVLAGLSVRAYFSRFFKPTLPGGG